MRARRHFVALALALAAAFPALAADRAAEMRRTLGELTGLGPRPSGSAANARGVKLLAAWLRDAGWNVRVSGGTGSNAARGVAGRATNVVATLAPNAPTTLRETVLFAAHHDTELDSPGAADNGIAVAALVSAARELGREPGRKRAVVLLFTDAEERGSLGADLFVRSDPATRAVTALVNFDSVGSSGRLVAYQTAGADRALLDAIRTTDFADGAPRPYSFASDIYRVMPFSTDFTILSSLNVPAVNLGLVGGSSAYHTPLDTPERLSDDTLRHFGGAASALLRRFAIDAVPLAAQTSDAFRHPVAGIILRWSAAANPILLAVALLLALAAIVRLTRGRVGEVARVTGLVALSFVAGLAATSVVTWTLRMIKGVDQVAHGRPELLAALLAAVTLLVAFAVDRKQRSVESKLAVVLLIWSALAALVALQLPGTGGLFVLPLAMWSVAGLARATRWRAAAMGAAAISTIALWAAPLALLVPFLGGLSSKFAFAEPLLFWPVLVALLGVLLGTKAWAAVPADRDARRKALLATGTCALALAVRVAALPAYDAAAPHRVLLFHVTSGGGSYWALRSADRLPVAVAAAPSIADDRDLWWLPNSASRGVRRSQRQTALPAVSLAREGGRTWIDVRVPERADSIVVSIENADVRATVPVSTPRGGRTVLARTVAGDESVRFAVDGTFSAQSKVRVMSIGGGLPARRDDAELQAWTAAAPAVFIESTLGIVDVPVGETR